jgi:hypothetical protein
VQARAFSATISAMTIAAAIAAFRHFAAESEPISAICASSCFASACQSTSGSARMSALHALPAFA